MAFKQSPPLFQVPGLSDAARQLITRLFFRSLIIYLLLDGLIFLLFGGGQWRWWLLFAAEAAACFPEGTAVTVSEQHAELLDFLDTDETTLVLCRAAVPYAEAGPGFAYAAPGRELREVWKDQMTNAVSGAELVPGWLPVFGLETVRELETALADTEKSL